MYEDYKRSHYWDLLEAPPHGCDIHIVRAERSDRWSEGVVRRLEQITGRTHPEHGDGRVAYHVLPNAGHWLHVDNPKGLQELMTPSIVDVSSHLLP